MEEMLERADARVLYGHGRDFYLYATILGDRLRRLSPTIFIMVNRKLAFAVFCCDDGFDKSIIASEITGELCINSSGRSF